MKRTFKIAAAMLALVMVLLMLPTAPVQAAEGNTYVLDTTTDLEAMAPSADNDGKEIVVNNYFTVIMGEKTKIDSSSKEFEDGYTASQRLNFQHKSKADDNGVVKPAVKFTTSGAATIKLWWVQGGDDNRQMAIFNANGEVIAKTEVTAAKNDKVISELTVDAAGTYYLGTPDGSNYLFKMEVTEAAASEPETTAPAAPETTAPAAPETTAPVAPETTAPAAPETTVAPTTPGENVTPTGDNTMLFVIFAMMTMAVPAALVLKKKYF